MNKLWVVIKNELMRYFISPLAYVYLLSFLILNASFAIYFGDFFNRGQADLLPMFDFQPWLYLLFIPGISMRLWAEEFRQKTIVQIVTMPVSIRTLVVGKFLAAWLFCGVALILTFPFWVTVNFLGTPDNSVIALGYVASFALAGCMLAISQTMSALTKNQVIALVLAVIANLFFF
jgi:ABC-2 type transport system permease protein